MHAFRALALTYALVALLIAPAWLTADDRVEPAPVPAAPQTVEQAPAAVEPAPAAPADEAPAEPPAAVAQEADEPAVTEARAAGGSKDRAKQQRKPEPVARAAASGSVTITDFEYTPATITVNEGDTVTWTNKGPTMHTATADDGSFDTGNLDKGESGSATFTSAGTIPYICTPHPFMKGKVVVRAAAAGDDDSGSGTTGGDDTADDGAAAGEIADSGDDDSDGLPATGNETLLIALLGLATLGAGLLLRRRATTDAR